LIPVTFAAAYLGAIGSTHAALSGGFVGWSAVTPASPGSLTEPTAAEYAKVFPTSQAYSRFHDNMTSRPLYPLLP